MTADFCWVFLENGDTGRWDCLPEIFHSSFIQLNKKRIRGLESKGRGFQLLRGEGSLCCSHPLWMNRCLANIHFSGITVWLTFVLSVLEYCAATTSYLLFIISYWGASPVWKSWCVSVNDMSHYNPVYYISCEGCTHLLLIIFLKSMVKWNALWKNSVKCQHHEHVKVMSSHCCLKMV